MMDYANRGKYFRRIILTGMNGEFRTYSTRINQGIESMGRTTGALMATIDGIGSGIRDEVAQATGEADVVQTRAYSMREASAKTEDEARLVEGAAVQASDAVGRAVSAANQVSDSMGENLRPCRPFGQHRRRCRQSCRGGDHGSRQPCFRCRNHRRGGRVDRHHRGADQPARAQRHDRGGARRRGGQGLCGGGGRSEKSRQPDRPCHPRHLRADRPDAGGHASDRRRDRRSGAHHRRHQRHRPTPSAPPSRSKMRGSATSFPRSKPRRIRCPPSPARSPRSTSRSRATPRPPPRFWARRKAWRSAWAR